MKGKNLFRRNLHSGGSTVGGGPLREDGAVKQGSLSESGLVRESKNEGK